MRTIEINGKNFDSLNGFYDEIEKHLIEGECPWGRNLDSLHELVSCCFNYTDNSKKDVSQIVWYDFDKSKREIIDKKGSKSLIEILEDILTNNRNIKFEKK